MEKDLVRNAELYSYLQEIIAQAEKNLAECKELERRFINDDFPHYPLVPLYKRPPIPPDYC